MQISLRIASEDLISSSAPLQVTGTYTELGAGRHRHLGENTTMSQSPSDVTREYAGIADLTTSDRHRVLAAEHRRVALDILSERDAPVELEDLAGATAAREADGDIADKETVEKVALRLHHVHLPLLAQLGVIDYDPEATLVDSCPRCSDS